MKLVQETVVSFDPLVLEELREALVRLALEPEEVLAERKMFGGVCITLNGKMLAGVSGNRLVFRAEPQDLAAAESLGVAGPMDFTGRTLRRFAYVYPEKLQPDDWRRWLNGSAQYVRRHMLSKNNASRG